MNGSNKNSENVFLEISIQSTTETELTEAELIDKIAQGFFRVYGTQTSIINYKGKPCVRTEFPSREAFAKIYERQYSMYVYIFDEFLKENLAISDLFSEWLRASDQTNEEGNFENYLVLRYRTNCLEPMRQFYDFSAKINKFFGSRIINESVIDGFLRFIHTKEDFEILLLPGDIEDAWRETFKIRGVSLDNPLIQKFFETIRKWKTTVWKKERKIK